MKLLMHLKKLLKNLYLSLKRFPYTIAFSTATTIMLITLINYKSSFNANTVDTLTKTAMTLALGFPLSLSLSLLFERINDFKKITKIIILLGAGLLLPLYYFYLLNELNLLTSIRYIAVNITLYLTALMIHYLYQRENFELYIVHIASRAFVTAIYSVVLYLGSAATIFTLNKLLGLTVSPQIYNSTWFAVIGIFAPIVLLAGLPTYQQKLHTEDYPSFLKVLLLYIVMPLISIYTIILYSYFIKLLLIWQWPQGLVSHLVIWYSAISLAVIFAIAPLSKNNKWVKYFSFLFPKVILPLLIMMFFAIGIRISEYGVTENRYYVVLLGCWILGIMMYYNLIDRKRNIVLPLSLALIIFLSVFGPWSSFAISINSQNKRFEELLYRNDMIKKEKVVKNEGTINQNDKKEINAIITYFKNNHSLEQLNYLPADFTIKNMDKFFGFSYQPHYRYNRDKYISLYIDRYPIRISGYDYYFEIPNYYPKKNEENLKTNHPLTLIYNKDDFVLKINYNNKTLYQKSLSEDITDIYRKIKDKPKTKLAPNDYAFIDENKEVQIKIIVKRLSGRIDNINKNDVTINSVQLIVCINLKD